MNSSDILSILASRVAMGAILGLIPGFVAKKKGRNFWGYYFGSFIISPILMWLIVSCLSNLNDPAIKKFKCQDCGCEFTDHSDCPQCGSHNVSLLSDSKDTSEDVQNAKKNSQPNAKSIIMIMAIVVMFGASGVFSFFAVSNFSSANKKADSKTIVSNAYNAGRNEEDLIATVYADVKNKVYHQKNCADFKGKYESIALREALARGYAPCKYFESEDK